MKMETIDDIFGKDQLYVESGFEVDVNYVRTTDTLGEFEAKMLRAMQVWDYQAYTKKDQVVTEGQLAGPDFVVFKPKEFPSDSSYGVYLFLTREKVGTSGMTDYGFSIQTGGKVGYASEFNQKLEKIQMR
jgi:hypothetical protein